MNSLDTCDASGLAATGRAIGVSINYRLGAFGSLSLSQYGGELSEASNLCLKDIIAALQWIHRNISKFGGDPDNVTISGHSAGAFNCLALLAAPEASIISLWQKEERIYYGLRLEKNRLYKESVNTQAILQNMQKTYCVFLKV